MIELKPCPFCGSLDLSVFIKGCDGKKYAVCCNTCDARGARKRNKEQAEKAWNTRSDRVNGGGEDNE